MLREGCEFERTGVNGRWTEHSVPFSIANLFCTYNIMMPGSREINRELNIIFPC